MTMQRKVQKGKMAGGQPVLKRWKIGEKGDKTGVNITEEAKRMKRTRERERERED